MISDDDHVRCQAENGNQAYSAPLLYLVFVCLRQPIMLSLCSYLFASTCHARQMLEYKLHDR